MDEGLICSYFSRQLPDGLCCVSYGASPNRRQMGKSVSLAGGKFGRASNLQIVVLGGNVCG